MAISVRQLAALAFCTVITVVLYILPLVLQPHAWWSLLGLLPILFLPVPWIIFGSPRDALGFSSPDADAGVRWAEFLTAFFASGVLGIPFILWHTHLIPTLALILNLSGSFVCLCTVSLFAFWQSRDVEGWHFM